MASMVVERDRHPNPVASRTAADESTCVCGQPLECSHTAHCPRCGVDLG